MTGLIWPELEKAWKKANFLSLMALLLLSNLFFLWYETQPAEPPLSAYQSVWQDISGMTEEEKLLYIRQGKEQADGVALVEQVKTLYGRGNQSGNKLARQLQKENPGIYEKYEDLYQSGDYLLYTESLAQERALMDQLYEEISKVAEYETYLEEMEENAGQAGSISIFRSPTGEKTFIQRNLEKSAADHAGLYSANIRWFPSKGIVMAIKNPATDMFLILSVFLFVGQLILEEKEKGLFALTRATRRGLSADMSARIFAILLHCGMMCLLLYGLNLLYAAGTAGLGDLSSALQSIAPYMESSLPISSGLFLLFVLLTKMGAAFLLGLLLAGWGICCKRSFMPQLAGIGFLGSQWLCYSLIPAYSSLNLLKHLSYFGLLQSDTLYGEYLNLNLMGMPVGRMSCGLILLAAFLLVGIGWVLLVFRKRIYFSWSETSPMVHLPFRPYDSLFRHEGYKILIAGRGLLILLIFLSLCGVHDLEKKYEPSPGEQYYQELMLSLEGRLTGEKEDKILAEQARYEEAFTQIARIDRLVEEGSISETRGDTMKEPWYGQLVFYSWFQRAYSQYERILSDGGVFLYDTGYLYLLGQMDDSLLIDLLLLSLCIIFAFSNVMAMEESKGAWNMLSPTLCGKKKILRCKWMVCSGISTGITLVPWTLRFFAISAVYPMGQILAGVQNIPQYQTFPVDLPVLLFLLLAVISQIAATQLVCGAVLLVSKWSKNYFQALFLALLLAFPLVLAEMGLDAMKWFSVWPLYGWTGLWGN